jgi:hypothetical protein
MNAQRCIKQVRVYHDFENCCCTLHSIQRSLKSQLRMSSGFQPIVTYYDSMLLVDQQKTSVGCPQITTQFHSLESSTFINTDSERLFMSVTCDSPIFHFKTLIQTTTRV